MKDIISRILFPDKAKNAVDNSKYSEWIRENEKKITFLPPQNTESGEYFPKISIIMPVWNTGEKWLQRAIQSVIEQDYKNWELCIADGNSTNPEVKKVLGRYSRRDGRIKIVYLTENKGIAGNTNEALGLAQGEFTGFLDHDDTLSNNCLSEVIKVLKGDRDIDIVYSDNDMIDESECRTSPFFKFDFSLPAFLSTNYPFHFFLCRKSLVDSVGGLRVGFEGAQDYDLILRLVEKTTTERIAHIDKILYHWRTLPTSSAHSPAAKPHAYNAGKRAIEEYLARNHIKGEVYELEPGSYRVKKRVIGDPAIILMIISGNSKVNETFTAFFNNLLSISNCKTDLILSPAIYAGHIHGNNQKLYDDCIREVETCMQNKKDCRVLFLDDTIPYFDSSRLNPDWIAALTEHFGYFNVGLAGTGSLTFHNILCNVERTCGPVFCAGGDLVTGFYKKNPAIPDFDSFQIQLSDFARFNGLDNIYTPFSVGNLPNYRRISDYYTSLEGKYFKRNMKYYLPDLSNA